MSCASEVADLTNKRGVLLDQHEVAVFHFNKVGNRREMKGVQIRSSCALRGVIFDEAECNNKEE